MQSEATLALRARHTSGLNHASGTSVVPLSTGLLDAAPEAKVTSISEHKPRRFLVSQYTKEERSRGGLKSAAIKRGMVHDAIDALLPVYLADVLPGKRVVMTDFMAIVCPHLKNVKAAVRRYGAYIKARLKYHEAAEPVIKMGQFIDAIKAGLAKRFGKPFCDGVFKAMKGFLHRLSSNPLKTSCRRGGAEWQAKIGCWGYFEDRETGETYA